MMRMLKDANFRMGSPLFNWSTAMGDLLWTVSSGEVFDEDGHVVIRHSGAAPSHIADGAFPGVLRLILCIDALQRMARRASRIQNFPSSGVCRGIGGSRGLRRGWRGVRSKIADEI